MPKVSVVIPCYNYGQYLREAVDSVRNQTFSDYKFVVIDDGSPDVKTQNVLKELEKEGVTVLYKKNGGVSSARNFGARALMSDYLLFLDADDYLHPDFLKKTTALMDADEQIGIVGCHLQTFGSFRTVWKCYGGGVEDFIITHGAAPSGSLIRRKCFNECGGYDESMLNSEEDWDLFLGIAERGWKIASTCEVLFYYRVKRVSLNMRAQKYKVQNIRHIVEKHQESFARNVTLAVCGR